MGRPATNVRGPQVGKFDNVMLFVVTADMVFKPYWTEVVTLGVFAVVLGAAAYFFLASGLRPAPVQASEQVRRGAARSGGAPAISPN